MSDSCTLRLFGRTAAPTFSSSGTNSAGGSPANRPGSVGSNAGAAQHLAGALDAGAHLLLGQRPLPARIAVDHHQGRDELRPPAVELQCDRAAPRETGDVRRAELEVLDQRGEAVRVVREVEVRRDVGRLARARLVPRDDGELVGQALELRLPEAPIRRRAVKNTSGGPSPARR